MHQFLGTKPYCCEIRLPHSSSLPLFEHDLHIASPTLTPQQGTSTPSSLVLMWKVLFTHERHKYLGNNCRPSTLVGVNRPYLPAFFRHEKSRQFGNCFKLTKYFCRLNSRYIGKQNFHSSCTEKKYPYTDVLVPVTRPN